MSHICEHLCLPPVQPQTLRRPLLLQTVVGLYGLDATPTDQQHDHHEQQLSDKPDIVEPLQEQRYFFDIFVFCWHAI